MYPAWCFESPFGKTCYVSNCSLDDNQIGVEGGVAFGEALKNNHTLQMLRCVNCDVLV